MTTSTDPLFAVMFLVEARAGYYVGSLTLALCVHLWALIAAFYHITEQYSHLFV